MFDGHVGHKSMQQVKFYLRRRVNMSILQPNSKDISASCPQQSVQGGDGDSGEGREDLSPSIRDTNLLQVLLAVLWGHVCSLTPTPLFTLHICDREGAILFFFFPPQHLKRDDAISAILSNHQTCQDKDKEDMRLITLPHQSQPLQYCCGTGFAFLTRECLDDDAVYHFWTGGIFTAINP